MSLTGEVGCTRWVGDLGEGGWELRPGVGSVGVCNRQRMHSE